MYLFGTIIIQRRLLKIEQFFLEKNNIHPRVLNLKKSTGTVHEFFKSETREGRNFDSKNFSIFDNDRGVFFVPTNSVSKLELLPEMDVVQCD